MNSQQKALSIVLNPQNIKTSKYFNMKKSLLLILFVLSILGSQAQDWLTDIEQAKQEAAKSNNKIVLVFSGSDWCAPCIKLDKKIWESQVFKDYASTHFVMLRADFPKRKKSALSKEQQEHNNQLAEKYNKQGMFPLVLVLDKDGKVKGKTGFKNLSPADYIKHLESFN